MAARLLTTFLAHLGVATTNAPLSSGAKVMFDLLSH
jgi:hypothetical protein